MNVFFNWCKLLRYGGMKNWLDQNLDICEHIENEITNSVVGQVNFKNNVLFCSV